MCSNAQWVTPQRVVKGRVEVSNLHIFFFADSPAPAPVQPFASRFASEEEDKEGPGDGQQPPSTPHQQNYHQQQQQQQQQPQQQPPPSPFGVRRTSGVAAVPGGSSEAPQSRTKRWALLELSEVHGRRYLLRSTALELFFRDTTNVFLVFPSERARGDCYNAVLKQNPPNLERTFTSSLKPSVILERSGVTDKWRRREISNFEYLMELNTIAGRSYNDISQYPVFPVSVVAGAGVSFRN